MRIYRCYSPSRGECAEDWNGRMYGDDCEHFAEIVDERNCPDEPGPHDWRLQSADVRWQEAKR